MSPHSHRLVLACLSLAVVGCEDSGSTSLVTCAPQQLQQPCGGDLVGTWKLSCAAPFGLGISITSPPEEEFTFDPSGNYTFSVSGPDFVVNIPSAELVPGAGSGSWESCTEANDNAASFGGTCATVGDTCACTFPTSGQGQMGTWTTSGSYVTLAQPTSALKTGYCVAADTLTLMTRFANFPTDAVFTKQ